MRRVSKANNAECSGSKFSTVVYFVLKPELFEYKLLFSCVCLIILISQKLVISESLLVVFLFQENQAHLQKLV